MGQIVVVKENPSSNRGIVRFETNRMLTGMGHENYQLGQEIWGERPPDTLGRRLLATGQVARVHVNGNVVTVDLAKGHDSAGLKEIIEQLYVFYDEEQTERYLAVEAEKAAKAAAAAEAEARAAAEAEAAAAEAASGSEPESTPEA